MTAEAWISLFGIAVTAALAVGVPWATAWLSNRRAVRDRLLLVTTRNWPGIFEFEVRYTPSSAEGAMFAHIEALKPKGTGLTPWRPVPRRDQNDRLQANLEFDLDHEGSDVWLQLVPLTDDLLGPYGAKVAFHGHGAINPITVRVTITRHGEKRPLAVTKRVISPANAL